jgi:hypothetical protein
MTKRIAALLDIDGTLIITGGAGAAASRLAFEELYGIPARDRGPPAWRIACREGPEAALIDDVLWQRRFVQHRRLEVDLGCGSCQGHPGFLSRLSVSAVAASRESSMATRGETDRFCAVRVGVA